MRSDYAVLPVLAPCPTCQLPAIHATAQECVVGLTEAVRVASERLQMAMRPQPRPPVVPHTREALRALELRQWTARRTVLLNLMRGQTIRPRAADLAGAMGLTRWVIANAWKRLRKEGVVLPRAACNRGYPIAALPVVSTQALRTVGITAARRRVSPNRRRSTWPWYVCRQCEIRFQRPPSVKPPWQCSGACADSWRQAHPHVKAPRPS